MNNREAVESQAQHGDDDVLRTAFEKTSWFDRFADERKEYSPALENYCDEELSDLFSAFVDGANLFASQAKRIAEQLKAIEATADFAKAFWQQSDKNSQTRVAVATFKELERKLRTYLQKNGE